MEEKSRIGKSVIIAVLIMLVLMAAVLIINPGSDKDCYYEEGTLIKQYLDNTSYDGAGDCSEGCLFMDVYTEHIYFESDGHMGDIKWENRTYFFAYEKTRDDLFNGDKIITKWCFNENQERRIRSVKKQ